MAQRGGARDRPESPPSQAVPIVDNSTAPAPVIPDPLRYIATTLKEVERGFDELNQGLGYTEKYGGRRTVRERDEEFQLSLSRILVNQQAEIRRLAARAPRLSTAGASEDREDEEEKEWEDHPLLESLGHIEARLVEAQATNVEQAAHIHRLIDTFEKFGDLGEFVSWLGVRVRWVVAWVCGSGLTMIVALALAGFLVGIKHKEMQANAVNMTMATAAEGASRIEFILESNPEWKELFEVGEDCAGECV